MASENDNYIGDSDDSALHDVSLESILAEYKGSAYINGDKKTPKELLNEQADKIIKEALGEAEPDPMPSSISAVIEDGIAPDAESEAQADPIVSDSLLNSIYAMLSEDSLPEIAPAAESASPPRDLPEEQRDTGGDRDGVVVVFDNFQPPEPEAKDTLIKEVEKAVEREIGFDEVPEVSEQLSYGIFERTGIDGDELIDDEDEIYEEPELKDVLKRFAQELSSISFRIIPAAIITIIMIMLTFAAEAGLVIPFGIGRNQAVAAGVHMLLLLVVMILCVDIIVRGAGDLVRGAPNAETLVLFSCAFSFISGAFSVIRGAVDILPYCTVSAVSLMLAAFGERLSLRAITETLKTAVVSSEPYGVQAEYNVDINKSVLKKAYNRTDGFYSNLMHPDISETAYRYAAPILLAAALVMSVIKVAVRGGGEYFLHMLSALLAAAAPFSVMLTFSIPFGIVSRAVRKSGAAIAGWGGVDDICNTYGASVTDDDLFPPGTLSFNGAKLYNNVSPSVSIRYTASLIMASGSGLSRLFYEVLKTQKMEAVRVNDFTCYEGGIGGRVHGDQVYTGSAAFMQLNGVEVPDDLNITNALFTAINNKLAAFFVIEYSPVNSVQSALISMLKWRIKLFFAMRDFNITPKMLEQKYRVSLEDIVYVQAKDSYSISDSFSGSRGRMAALLAREGLGPYAEAITGGRLLRSAALVATAVSIISAALGVIFMFYMFWNDALISAKPGNLLLFMLCTLAAVLVVCGYVKCKK